MKHTQHTRRGFTQGYFSKGFTLIELLVVVLIIGILAAVALPQYQKVVERSKATQALTMLKSIAQAAETYYLANSMEFTSFDELAIDIPWPQGTTVIGVAPETRSNGQWALEREPSSSTIVWMTRLNGKYKGAGLAITLANTTSHNSVMKTWCYERKSSSTITFDTSLAEGAYCVQIMKGTFDHGGTTGRYYTLQGGL